MCGAQQRSSAEELSAIVHWYYWGLIIGKLIRDSSLYFNPSTVKFLDIFPVALLVLGSLCSSAVLIMDYLYHKWLDTNNKTGNSINLIFGVLNHATRKNKYPRLRSAFTYIDEAQPSHLDFEKHKFGGPFTEEEVEDVKPIFRFLFLLVAVLVPGLLLSESCDQLAMCSYIKSSVISFIFIPVYRFIVYPLIGKYIPSLLKMISVGLSLSLLSTVISLTRN